jgi:hypothetical protein
VGRQWWLVVHVRTREPVLLLGELDGDRCLPVLLRRPHAEVVAVGWHGRPPDQQLRDFREFLDEVSPDDFDTPRG